LGWMFEVSQKDWAADFAIDSEVSLGDGIAVFAAYNSFEHASSVSTTISECRGQQTLAEAAMVLDERPHLRGAVKAFRAHDILPTPGTPSLLSDLLGRVPMPQQSSLSSVEVPVTKLKEPSLHADLHDLSSGRVLCTVTLTGWSTPDVDVRTTSHVVSRAVAASVGEKFASVRVQVLKAEREPGTTVAMTIDFEVVPISAADVNRKMLDIIEAKLILLGIADSQAKQHFDTALAVALAPAERHTQLHAKFMSVVQLP